MEAFHSCFVEINGRIIEVSLQNYLFTSESVSEGHPDKVADQISDGVVDAYLSRDPEARVAVETLVTTNRIILAGEVRSSDPISNETLEEVARGVVKEIGYEQDGFHWKNAEFQTYIHRQSVDISMGVDAGSNKDEGAGDQGIMFGYACRETDVLMPAPVQFSHDILKSLALSRHNGDVSYLEPDSKSQVTLRYINDAPVGAAAVVVSTQHKPGVTNDELREFVRTHVEKVLPSGWMCPEDEFYVNPTGQFIIGGPDGDTGLTGRKIIVDTYGGAAPHGGGAFSGKDPTKVDRSAAYISRYLAKNVVAAGLGDRCTIQLAYAIGVSKPLSLYVDLHETGQVDEEKLANILAKLVDLSPKGIREYLNLNKPIYRKTAAYGHFGRTPEADGSFSWEKTDIADSLKSEFS
jgi:S-adenosylmethionine synthetase